MRRLYGSFMMLFCLGSSVNGCDASSHDAHQHEETSGTPFSDEPIAGLEAESENLKMTLVEVEPDPAIKGINHWKILIETLNGDAVLGAHARIEPSMPQHNHVSNPSFFEAVELSEPGYYEFESIRLFMVGNWEINAFITINGVTESLVFYVDATN